MRKLNYRLIVSDFDGTLINDNQQVPRNVRDAIDEYVTNGGIFAVCTGRMLTSILPQVRSLGLKGLVIAYQGSVIAEIESGRILKTNAIPYFEAAEICRELEKMNLPVNAYSDGEMYTNIPEGNEYLRTYERIVRVNAKRAEGKISEFIERGKKNCQKVLIFASPEQRERLYAEIKSVFGGRFDVTCSASVLIEISPLGDHKGEAVKFLSEYFKVPMSLTLAAGDNLNDLPMIKAAGTGVAVGNAVKELKEAADFVSVTNNEGAIAQIIDKYGFVNEND